MNKIRQQRLKKVFVIAHKGVVRNCNFFIWQFNEKNELNSLILLMLYE